MFGDMMGKLKEAQEKAAETKKRLDTVYVSGEAGNGAVRVTATANRAIKSVHIDDALLQEDKEQLEDLLIIALNKALDDATQVNETEMKGAAQGLMPNIPGLSGLFS
ncbi:MAG: YbaB/EbfC family nucleoid-associated protein [Bacteroidota bacterium]